MDPSTPVTIAHGWDPEPGASLSLHADAYTQEQWFEADRQKIIGRSWQWLCHVEKLRDLGSYVAGDITGMPIVAVRNKDGELHAFYNVCKHRAHQLLEGEGTTNNIVCPYHAWSYDLGGQLTAARHSNNLVDFDKSEVCLDQVQITEFGGFVYVNLDRDAPPLAELSGDLGAEITLGA